MKTTFDSYLSEKCPSELQTNNSPEGFERWLETLDVAQVMEYAEGYGKECYGEGTKAGVDAGMAAHKQFLDVQNLILSGLII